MLGSLVLLIESLVQCLLNANEKGSERLQPLQVVFAPVLPAFQRAKLLKIAMEQSSGGSVMLQRLTLSWETTRQPSITVQQFRFPTG